MGLREKVEDYVAEQLTNYNPGASKNPKVIHDTILGSNLFKPYEIEFIDSPIVQRLRGISQVDVASLVFPSGNHNRFEHTLGVAVIAQKMMESIYQKSEFSEKFKEDKEWFVAHVKIAAIMHDTGHGPFSHLSEMIYKYCSDYEEISEEELKFKAAKPHEVLSYLIIKSPSMRRFADDIIRERYSIDLDLELIGNMIIGHVDDNYKDKAFLVDIINGAFDADKIDYIQRDSHFTGIKLVLDLHRLLYTIGMVEVDGYNRLCVDMSGVAALEQITFSKMILYSTVYHHQKVRAATSLMEGILKAIKEEVSTIYKADFDSASGFLKITDHEIYSLGRMGYDVSNTILAAANRQLPMRTAVVASTTISVREKFFSIIEFLENEKDKEDFKEAVWEEANRINPEIELRDIWMDFPKRPNFKEAVNCLIVHNSNDIPITLDKVFPMEAWVKAFSENKYKGYIFTKKEYREDVYKAVEKVFYDVFDVKILDKAKLLCKY